MYFYTYRPNLANSTAVNLNILYGGDALGNCSITFFLFKENNFIHFRLSMRQFRVCLSSTSLLPPYRHLQWAPMQFPGPKIKLWFNNFLPDLVLTILVQTWFPLVKTRDAAALGCCTGTSAREMFSYSTGQGLF